MVFPGPAISISIGIGIARSGSRGEAADYLTLPWAVIAAQVQSLPTVLMKR
jgi:hypothetical protein